MEIGQDLSGGTMWRIATDDDTFRLTLVDADVAYFLDPRMTAEGITLGQAQRNMLHDRLDAFINRHIGMTENEKAKD